MDAFDKVENFCIKHKDAITYIHGFAVGATAVVLGVMAAEKIYKTAVFKTN